jgi:hypothetical protein
MNPIDFENTFDSGLLDEEYMDYIMEHADPTVYPIHNGDSLLSAFEAMYLYNEFKQYKLSQ